MLLFLKNQCSCHTAAFCFLYTPTHVALPTIKAPPLWNTLVSLICLTPCKCCCIRKIWAFILTFVNCHLFSLLLIVANLSVFIYFNTDRSCFFFYYDLYFPFTIKCLLIFFFRIFPSSLNLLFALKNGKLILFFYVIWLIRLLLRRTWLVAEVILWSVSRVVLNQGSIALQALEKLTKTVDSIFNS